MVVEIPPAVPFKSLPMGEHCLIAINGGIKPKPLFLSFTVFEQVVTVWLTNSSTKMCVTAVYIVQYTEGTAILLSATIHTEQVT